jgi:HK97 family phage prohead protease
MPSLAPPDALETRYQPGHLRVALGDGLRPKLTGHAIVFNAPSETLGFFREQIAPQAIQRTFDEGIDVRALVDHDPAKILGRVSARTLKIAGDPHGLLVEIDPPDTTYARDVLESVRRGDLSGMSFAFRTLIDEWDESVEPPMRTVKDMRISEVSIVTFPAYPQTDVDVAQRSLSAYRAAKPFVPSLALRRRMLELP